MASVMGIGQAVGTAAALSVKEDIPVSKVNTDELRDILLSYGTNLKN